MDSRLDSETLSGRSLLRRQSSRAGRSSPNHQRQSVSLPAMDAVASAITAAESLAQRAASASTVVPAGSSDVTSAANVEPAASGVGDSASDATSDFMTADNADGTIVEAPLPSRWNQWTMQLKSNVLNALEPIVHPAIRLCQQKPTIIEVADWVLWLLLVPLEMLRRMAHNTRATVLLRVGFEAAVELLVAAVLACVVVCIALFTVFSKGPKQVECQRQPYLAAGAPPFQFIDAAGERCAPRFLQQSMPMVAQAALPSVTHSVQ